MMKEGNRTAQRTPGEIIVKINSKKVTTTIVVTVIPKILRPVSFFIISLVIF